MADNVLIKDIYWLAGLLEGEGCFYQRKGRATTDIRLAMTDKDVVIRAAKIMNACQVKHYGYTKSNKPIYLTQIHGRQAVGWMMTLLPLMGERRAAHIKKCLRIWKECSLNHPSRSPKTSDKTIWMREGGL